MIFAALSAGVVPAVRTGAVHPSLVHDASSKRSAALGAALADLWGKVTGYLQKDCLSVALAVQVHKLGQLCNPDDELTLGGLLDDALEGTDGG